MAALLAAAGTAFADKGYDATTMTEIAAGAGASIGSLYQFFPTKELLADALVQHYAEALYERLARFEAAATGWSADELGRRLLPLLIEFRADHPAFATLVETSGAQAARGGPVRARLRRQIVAILQRHAPALPADRLEPIAVAVLQIMKGAVMLNAESGLTVREAALDELSVMLGRYLDMHLGVGAARSEEL
ncbi:MAG TPA: TetR/AcrR family transcriptional regulator [Aliidongia sp.]|uniref:TetR/AcrR family transcriptional regulator n=1 Tax=Aliidongia sp. TaxID=1914230 RepID=UPI002DDD0EEF|nr:TetR/AcrR family transcriptional regulator [Aliidongia sp.]HEV2675316.1 TetR/AcrR family transcriptional regulator [Aliidongia sp.]